VHTAPAKSGNPDITLNEVGALDAVIKWAQVHCPNEKDFIVVGDFNADCSYVDEDDLEERDIQRTAPGSFLILKKPTWPREAIVRTIEL
jgi:hypothetical protein